MNIVTEINEYQAYRKLLQQQSIGFVPTMGNLHDGHASLCQKSLEANDVTIVSIFVNPTQFNNNEDLTNYPRTLEADIQILNDIGVNCLFMPKEEALYHDDYHVNVIENALATQLEGEFRPGHFTGMLTVVMKLLNIIQPSKAYFGEKDYQQLLLVKKMVSALFLPFEIVACQTLRAADGLALSSRNTRLTNEHRQLASYFPKLLNSDLSEQDIKDRLTLLGFEVEYIVKKWGRRLGAVKLGDVRLIDNIILT